MATKPRSPNYPGCSLPKALEYVRKVYNQNHLHKAPREVLAKSLGYGSLNGASLVLISALKKYGLLEEDQAGLKISPDALIVLVEGPASHERARTIVKLATEPALFAEMQAAFPGPAPSDELLRSWLLRKGFLPSVVDLPIRTYRETMELAEAQKAIYSATAPEPSPSPSAPPSDTTDPPAAPPEVGDLIQWESGGVLRMEAPRKVRAKQEHEGEWWVFVEGSETGIPMDETTVIERAVDAPAAEKRAPTLPLVPDLSKPAHLNPGESEASRGKLGGGVSYRLLVSGGDIEAKHIGKLIKLLQAQQAVLSEVDDED